MALEPSSGSVSLSFTSYSRAFRMMKLTLSSGRFSEGSCGRRPRCEEDGTAEAMSCLHFFSFCKNAHRPRAFRHQIRVDGREPRPYIGGGPRLPNEALSFWKE